ncbi:TIR domain-containing protein [uncultured Devosia sp.]|uniref:TIR domain-containing protein n=1 Tax=uncultured Devosia sp. TaxID=211434 RepID=UPI00262CEFFE|nr:TIR domain-containing protein [uncultured Devosia sp.]
MPKRLFISHSWSYSERYNSMVNLLVNRPYFEWQNYSVPESKAFLGLSASSLKEQLRNQIRPVQCVIIIGGMWTNYSDWIQFEIDFAKSIDKPILGVRPRSAKVMPQAVINASDAVVNWNSDSIVAGIRQIS